MNLKNSFSWANFRNLSNFSLEFNLRNLMNFKSLKQAHSLIKFVGHVAWARWMGGREEVRGSTTHDERPSFNGHAQRARPSAPSAHHPSPHHRGKLNSRPEKDVIKWNCPPANKNLTPGLTKNPSSLSSNYGVSDKEI